MANVNNAFADTATGRTGTGTPSTTVAGKPDPFPTVASKFVELKIGQNSTEPKSGTVSGTNYDNVTSIEIGQHSEASTTLLTDGPHEVPNIPPDITKSSQSNPARQGSIKKILSKLTPDSSPKSYKHAVTYGKPDGSPKAGPSNSPNAASGVKITLNQSPTEKPTASNGHSNASPIKHIDDGIEKDDPDHLSPRSDHADPEKISLGGRGERFLHQKLLPKISKRLPKLPEEFAPNLDNQHMAKFAKITDDKVAETQKQRRMTMELCKTAAHKAKCCGAVKACIHHNDCLNVAESVGGRLVFDKIGDLLRSKEINLDMSRCEFGHAMRDRHFAHLSGIMFNSASYGCTPDVVTQARQALEMEMQANNVLWRFKTVPIRVRQTEYALAQVLGTDPDDLVLVPNANYATNAVFKSQPWQPGDSLMIFSCDYDATVHAAEYLRWTHGVKIEIVDMPLPASRRAILRRVRTALESLKYHKKLPILANFCHVTSKSATIFPARKLVKLFHEFGVSVMVDGAQAAGQIPLNLSSIGADYYAGTMHKWMYSAPAVGFLVVDPTKQDLIEPLVVSYFYGSNFTKTFSYTGHMDFTGYITAHYALDFITEVCGGLRKVQKHLKGLAKKVVHLLTTKWHTRCCQKVVANYGAMPIIELPMDGIESPSALHAGALMLAMLEQYEMTVFIYVEEFFGEKMMVIRLACQIFHDISDFEKLGDAILELRPGQFLENRLDDVKNFVKQPFT